MCYLRFFFKAFWQGQFLPYVSRKMQKPPLTFEEFLQSQGLKSWPRCISLDEPHSLVDKLQKDCSFNALSKSLYEHVPLNVSSLSDLENRIKSCITDLKKHAEKISSLQCGPAYLEEQLIDLEQKITSEQTDAEKLLTQTSEMQKVNVAKYIVEESKGTNVENCNYPGFKIKQLLELPRHLEAPKLWNLVIKAQHFQKDILKVWRRLFLSKSSISVFQDSFWWWFLQRFKPNQEDQDHFFGRIAENFVVLFLLVPIEAKDTFFQVYPDCLSQVIYVTFCEAFPESIKNFDDDFKDGLVDLIFQWISGLKPRKCVWEKWNLESFKASTVNPNSEGATANIRAHGSARSAAACKSYKHFLSYNACYFVNIGM
ncbi:protein FAM227B [Anas acuta]|uniref:protein FAM227B n=1 Tax=Anas acuta TaxID=28680 RepID=UPI0035C91B81